MGGQRRAKAERLNLMFLAGLLERLDQMEHRPVLVGISSADQGRVQCGGCEAASRPPGLRRRKRFLKS